MQTNIEFYILLGSISAILIYMTWKNRIKKKRLTNRLKEIRNEWGNRKINEYLNIHDISKYHHQKKIDSTHFQNLDTQTIQDLDLNELFKYIDHTNSAIGQQYLYDSIRCFKSIEQLDLLKEKAQVFKTNVELREKTQLVLKNIASPIMYEFQNLFTLNHPKEHYYGKYALISTILVTFSIIITFVYPLMFIATLGLYIINLFIHLKNKSTINPYLKALKALNRLVKAHEKLNQLEVIQPSTKTTKKLKSLKNKSSYFNSYIDGNNELFLIFWVISENFKILFNIDYFRFQSISKRLNDSKQELQNAFNEIGFVDLALCSASNQQSKKTTCDVNFTNNQDLEILNITHPTIDNCVQNSINLDHQNLLLTGSNMSGKSTFLRTIGINIITSQTLGFAFASFYKAPFSRLFSSIQIADNLTKNKSYYQEEVGIMKSIIDNSKNERSIILADEIFKGTNTIDRISSATSILRYLNQETNIVITATHDIELTDLLVDSNYKLGHFSDNFINSSIQFDYKLKPGKLKKSNAIELLEINGFSKQIIEHAKQTKTQWLTRHIINAPASH